MNIDEPWTNGINIISNKFTCIKHFGNARKSSQYYQCSWHRHFISISTFDHCEKYPNTKCPSMQVSKYGVCSGLYFPAFGYFSCLSIFSLKAPTNRLRKNSVFGHFSRNECQIVFHMKWMVVHLTKIE